MPRFGAGVTGAGCFCSARAPAATATATDATSRDPTVHFFMSFPSPRDPSPASIAAEGLRALLLQIAVRLARDGDGHLLDDAPAEGVGRGVVVGGGPAGV